MTRKATMKWMKVVTFILALVLVVSFMPASVFAEDGDDNTIKVYMTISDKGTIAKTNDGDAMAWKEVTVSDLDGSGDFTYDEALKAAHKAYNSEDGFVVKSSGWVDSLWGVANNPASYYFTKNGKATDLTTTTKIAEGDYLLAAISLDTELSADWACSFDQFETIVTAGEELSLNLTGFASMTMSEATPSEDVSVGIWENGTYTEKAKTDENGNVKLTFDKPDTYIVTAEGKASTVFEQTDEYYPFMKVDKDVNDEPIWGKMDWSTYESFVAYTEEDFGQGPYPYDKVKWFNLDDYDNTEPFTDGYLIYNPTFIYNAPVIAPCCIVKVKAVPIDYSGTDLTFADYDGKAFGMWAPQDGTIIYKDGDSVVMHIVPRNKTTYGWLHWGSIYDDELTKDIALNDDGSIDITRPITDCGKAFPVAPIKKKDGLTTAGQNYLCIPPADQIKAETLAITNETGMFKVSKAIYDSATSTLIFDLNSTGYHYVMKGNYEDAAANGDNRDNWIAGTETADGKWEFVMKLDEGESYIPLVSISNSYLTKYEQGQNALERAFYPRQFKIDTAAKTLTTGDYEETKAMAQTNNADSILPIDSTDITIVSGPNSNASYKITLDIKMANDDYDSIFLGTRADAEKEGAESIALNGDNAFAGLVVETIGKAGDLTTLDSLIKDTSVFSFHNKNDGKWYEAKVTVTDRKTTIQYDLGDVENAQDLIDKAKADYDTAAEKQDAIDAANAALEGLTDDQKALLPNAEQDLADAQTAANAQKKAEDQKAADAVQDLIDKAKADYDTAAEKQDAIDAANAALEGLTDDQKALLPNAEQDLADAQTAANAQKKAEDDKKAADAVQDLIDKAKADYDTAAEKQDAIDAANAALEGLTDDQKALLPNAEQDLADAQTAANAQKKAEDDKKAADAVQDLIDKAKADYDTAAEKQDAIDAANAALEGLSDDQKALLPNAEQDLADAQTAADTQKKAEDDKKAADAVQDLIDKAKANYATAAEKQAAIDAANAALNGLSDEQKALLPNANQDLADAQTAANTQKKAEDEAAAAAKAPKVGETAKVGKLVYKVTSKTEAAVVKPVKKTEKKIVIPATVKIKGKALKVTSIGNNAFKKNTKMKALTIGKNVKSIGNGAFQNCTALTKITIPAAVQKIGKAAFLGCKKAKKLIIKGTSIKSFGKKAFAKTGIKKFSAPKKVKKAYRKKAIKAGMKKTVK